MHELKDDEVIDPNRLRPRELLVQIHEKVTRLEKQNEERSRLDLDVQLKINTLQVQMSEKANVRTKAQTTIWALIVAAVSSVLSALATRFFS
jgi:type IV secretory pathway VirD2 relaxase